MIQTVASYFGKIESAVMISHTLQNCQGRYFALSPLFKQAFPFAARDKVCSCKITTQHSQTSPEQVSKYTTSSIVGV